MPRLGRKLEVEITERGAPESRLVDEGEAIRNLAASGSFAHTLAQQLLEGSADSGTAVRTNYATYSAQWVGRKQTALRVVGNLGMDVIELPDEEEDVVLCSNCETTHPRRGDCHDPTEKDEYGEE